MLENLNIKELKEIIISQEEIIQKQDKQISNLIDKQFKSSHKFIARDLDMILYLTGKKL